MISFECEMSLGLRLFCVSYSVMGYISLADLMILDSSSTILNSSLSWIPRPHQIHTMRNRHSCSGRLLEHHVAHTLEILHC